MDLKGVNEGIHGSKRRKRVGRGPGSKRGRTATKGNKGQHSRTGAKMNMLKEGGQMPLFRRLPKRGFNNRWHVVCAAVNVADLNGFSDGETVTPQTLRETGLANKRHDQVKVLGNGELTARLEIHAHSFSKSAREKIEKAGGTCVLVPAAHRGPKTRSKMRPRKPKVPAKS